MIEKSKLMHTFENNIRKIRLIWINLKKMKELGTVNRSIARIISEQGHQDLLMVADAGFPIPKEVEVIDISLGENNPMVLTVLAELKRFFSVEKMIMANQTKETSPSLFAAISQSYGENMPVETIDHAELKQLAKNVKAVIRTGDFTAYGNVILVSGAGDRWYCEK
jgi:D-ribose pyranase